MNKKTIISLSIAAGLIGVTVWYLRQLSVQLRLVTPDTENVEDLELLDEVSINNFLARHPVRKNPTEAEAQRLLAEAREILADVEADNAA